MPTPTRQITGTFKDSDLQPAAGKKIKFIPLAYRTDTTNKVRLFEQSVEVTLDSNGQIPTSPQFTLVCTDATGVVPTLVGYQVTELFGNGPKHPYFIDVPTGVGALDMADIAPLANPPVPPEIFASIQAMEAGDAATLAAAEEYTDAHSGGGSFPASAAGWLHDDGTGTRAWTTPTAAQVGADTAAARDTAITTATAPLATSSALTTGLAGKQPIDTDLTTIAALDSAQAGVVASDGAGWIRKTYAQLKTALLITAADVGADTSAARDTAISTAINNLINAAPGTLDTLGEIASALQADESTAAALVTTVAGKQPLDADLTAIAALDASTAGAIASDGAGWVKKTYAQFKTALGLVKADVGLGNVDNTADSAKTFTESQVTGLVADLAAKVPTTRTVAGHALSADVTLAESDITNLTTDLAAKAPVSTTTIDLVDRTNNTTETVPAGTTTNCSTAGVTKTAPALDNPVGTPPKRFAVKNLSAGTITVAYPDQAAVAQSLVLLPAETRTFRQKSTSGWGVESGAVAIATLDARFVSAVANTGQSYTATPSDQSTTIQALIDTAGAAYLAGTAGSARAVELPSGVFYGSFKMRPGVILKGQGWATVLRAMAGQTAAVIDYATYDAYHCMVKDLRVDGNYLAGRTDGVTQGNCRAIDMSSSSADAAATPFPQGSLATDWPPPFAVYSWNSATLAGKWDNTYNTIENVAVTNIGGDIAVYIGNNQRGPMVSKLYIENCKAVGLQVKGTDGHYSQIDVGNCGDGIIITGLANKFVNCKSWYHGRLTGYTTGSGDGYRINIPLAQTIGGNDLTACEAQDCNRYGFAIYSGQSNRISGTSGASGSGAVLIGGLAAATVANNYVDVLQGVSDLAAEPQAVTLDRSSAVTATLLFNRVRVRANINAMTTTNPVVLLNSASLVNNDIDVTMADEGLSDFGSTSGTKNPNLNAAANFKFTMSGALTIGAVSTTAGWRRRITVIITGNNTNAVTWDATYGISGNSTTAFAGTKVWTFVNTATTSATPSWQLVANV